MKFKHLNVPTHWQNYWTRYPEGHTILEALISWVSQVDNMVDNQNNLNTNVEQFRKEIDGFVKLFDERLQEEVTQTLSDWQASGFIDVVISEALQWEFDDYKATNEQDKLSINQQLVQTDINLDSSAGVSINKYPRLENETDDTQRMLRAFNENSHIVFSGDLYVNGFTIPDYKVLTCNGVGTIFTTGTILLGMESIFNAPNVKIDATTVNIVDFSIIKLSKHSILDIGSIWGYRPVGSSHGTETVSKAVDATDSDFVQARIHQNVMYCKYVFYSDGGATGSGNTINASIFNCKWAGDCYYGFYHAGNSQTMILTSMYLEYCVVGYSLNGSLYGSHTIVFDNVTTWFENRDTSWRGRLGEVFLPNRTVAELLTIDDRFFSHTTFHCSDGSILPRAVESPNIHSGMGSKLFAKSGLSELRMTSDDSITYEGRYSPNDTRNGLTATIGGQLFQSKYTVEDFERNPLFEVGANGNVYLPTLEGGVVVKSPNGTRYKIYVDDGGVVKAISID